MFGLPWKKRDLRTAAERMRREHEQWLTMALRPGMAVSSIPVRETDRGGFEGIMSSPGGRYWVRKWWDDRFAELAGRSSHTKRREGAR